ncbi:MAG: polysaccharide deacetylase family protein [Candidatus Omnitrophica bacterium]|nr:polysaccharide deacetylase family protein [Candidatus Omnitrophota bacterium]
MLKHKRLIIVVILLGVLTLWLVNLARTKYVIPILMYHSVDPAADNDNLLSVTLDSFQRQMRFLKEHRYNVISLKEVADIIKNKKKVSANTIAITFDDGCRDVYIYAFPVLKKYNFPAEVFIVVNEVGLVQENRMSWDEVNAMQASGLIHFGSHTINHPNLAELTSEETIKNEIQGSKKILEEKLGRRVDSFCYPSGRFNAKSRKAVIDAGYELAVATNPGKGSPNDDIFALKRLRISSNADNLFIFWVESSGYYNLIREGKRK